MMYPYMTLLDDTEIVYSQIIDVDDVKKVIVHFERPTERGFDSARCELPDYKWIFVGWIFFKKENRCCKGVCIGI